MLTDFELLKQELTGLQVIETTQIQRSILVTSHYANKSVLEQATKTNTKILPKQLASEISIIIKEDFKYGNDEQTQINKVDAVIVDDDESFTKILVRFAFKNLNVPVFHNPLRFLDSVAQFPKDTKIYLDNNYAYHDIKGTDIAKKLHEQGFSRLYLLSGENFHPENIPSYLTVLRKDDIDSILGS